MIKLSRYFIPYIVFLMILGFRWNVLITIFFILIHELTHYLLAYKIGFKNSDISLSITGATLNLKDLDEATFKEKLRIFFIGPLFNLIVAIIFYFISLIALKKIYNDVFIINIYLFLFNMMPVLPLDGGSILREILANKTSYKKATKIVAFGGIIMSFVFFILFIVVGIEEKFNFTLLIASVLFLLTSYREYTSISYVIMGDIVKKKIRFNKKGIIENRSISVHCNRTMLQVLDQVDKNKYTIIWVLDDDMNIIDYISEGEILTAVKKYGNITLEEYYRE